MRINVEILPWLSNTLRQGTIGSLRFEHDVVGSTVADLLESLAAADPAFERLIYDRQARELRYPARAIVNGQLLEFLQGLDTQLAEGDTISLMATYTGGSGAEGNVHTPIPSRGASEPALSPRGSGPCRAERPSPLFLSGHLEEQLVEARVVGQFRMEGGGQQRPLTGGGDAAVRQRG